MTVAYGKLYVKDQNGDLLQFIPESHSTIDPSDVVHLSGTETISGAKTFSQGPFGTTAALTGTEINLANGSVFTKTISADTTFTIANAPSGKASQFILILTNGGAYEVTWPNSVSWPGDAPALAESGTNVLRFVSPDGTNWMGCMDGSGTGGGAKEIAEMSSEPTALNTTDLDNESIIFYNTGNSNGTNLQPVFTTGNQTVQGVKTFTAGVFGGKQTVSGSAFDCSAATCFTKTVSSSTTFSFTNVPEDAVCCITVILINGGNYTVTWPASVKWTKNLPPDLTENGTDVVTFITATGGNVWYGTATCLGVTA